MTNKKDTILIADDDSRIITALKLLLKAESYDVVAVSSPAELIQIVSRRDFSVALIDMNYQNDTTSGSEGLQLIEQIKKIDEQLPIVVMTGYSSVELAVETMKLGAADFIQKPWKNDRLLSILQAQIHIKHIEQKGRRLAQENALLKDTVSPSVDIVAHSTVMKGLLAKLGKLATSDMNVLITGENGTGKSMLADYIHQHSRRSENSLISVNMGAISESLFESEMFGHVKGAFTDAKEARIGRFELAEFGTLFLDEIANIPMSQQVKLLRVLEQHEFEKVGSSKTQHADVRIVSATNGDLNQLIAEGEFRQDLLYRLNTVEVEIPPLRERRDDIIPLANHFLVSFAEKYRLENKYFDSRAQRALIGYDWPGNVRELNHIIERAIFLSQSEAITLDDLGLSQQADQYAFDIDNATLEEIERHIIEERLQRFAKDVCNTSKSLGLSRSAYYRRLEKYDL